MLTSSNTLLLEILLLESPAFYYNSQTNDLKALMILQLELSLALEQFKLMTKPLNSKFGILLDRNPFDQSQEAIIGDQSALS